MIKKLLIDKYFDNKVRTYPFGAQYFFWAINNIDGILDMEDDVAAKEKELISMFKDSDEITVIYGKAFLDDYAHHNISLFRGVASKKLQNRPKKVLFSLVGGAAMTIKDLNDFAETVYEFVDPNADIMFGAMIDENIMVDQVGSAVIMGN